MRAQEVCNHLVYTPNIEFIEWGALLNRAEIIPLEPDAGNSAEGKVW